ncbi:hypothetical protein AB0O34_26770 [Sphaerisporangium sp. NPDC088356]
MPQDVRRRTTGGEQMVHAPESGDVAHIVSIWRPRTAGVSRPENRIAT